MCDGAMFDKRKRLATSSVVRDRSATPVCRNLHVRSEKNLIAARQSGGILICFSIWMFKNAEISASNNAHRAWSNCYEWKVHTTFTSLPCFHSVWTCFSCYYRNLLKLLTLELFLSMLFHNFNFIKLFHQHKKTTVKLPKHQFETLNKRSVSELSHS